MQPAKVLLLESVAAQAAAARNALVGAGYRLVISRFEGDGFVKIREWKPDIVVVSNTYTTGSLTDFCRRLLDEGAGSRIVVASSLPLKRLLADEPQLRTIAASFVLRPYNPAKLRQTIDGLVSGRSTAVEGSPEDRSLVGKRIFLAENDSLTAAAVAEHLAPLGITVDRYSSESSGHGAGGRPDAIVVGWPAPPGFNLEVLKNISAGGKAAPLIVLSAESQETIKSRAPGLFNRTKVIFTKPVPWSHFTRFLARLLAAPPAVPPSRLDERGRLLGQIDAQTREIAELKKRMFESGGRETLVDIDARDRAADELRARITELQKQVEMEKAKHQFRETELEVKLSSLLRKGSESEKTAQDLIDEGNERAEDMQRALSEAHGEIHLLAEEVGSLKKDLEETLIAKEHAEEELQAGRLAMEREKSARDEAKAKAAGGDAEVRKKLEDALESIDTYKERETALRKELKGHEETIALRDSELERMELELQGAVGEKKKLQEFVAELEEKIAAADGPREDEPGAAGSAEEIAGLRSALEASEAAVSALDGELASWRGKAAVSEASLADLSVREAELSELVAEKDRALRSLEEDGAALRAKVATLEAGVVESGELQRLREALDEREGALEELRFALPRAEQTARELRSRAEELEKESGSRAEEAEELGRALQAEREKNEEAEKEIALLQHSVGDGSSAEETGRLAVSLAESERIRQELLGRVEELRIATAALERERDEALERAGGLAERIAALEGEVPPPEQDGSAALLEEELAAVRSRNDELQRKLEKEAFEGKEKERAFREQLQTAEEEQGALRERIEGLIAEAATESEILRDARTLLSRRETEAEENLRRAEELAGQVEETGAALVREQEARLALQKSHDEKAAALAREMDGQESLRRKVEEQAEELQGGFVALEAARAAKGELEKDVGELRRELAVVKEELGEAQKMDRREEIEELEARLAEAREGAEEAQKEGRDAERIQKMLEEVTARAQAEIIEQSRKEVELHERLRTSIEEKKFLISRMEKELAGASERERRLSDLLEKSLKGSAQLAASLGRPIEPDNLPVAFVDGPRRPSRLLPALAAGAAALVIAGVAALAVYGLWDARKTSPPVSYPEASEAPQDEKARGGLSAQKEIWEDWSRSDVSGGVIFQATLRSPEEITASVDAEKKVRGWSEERASTELSVQLEPYRFDENYYFYIYLKNLEPGYPSYVEDIYANLYLRDDQGREARAFLPADLEKYRRVYSFSSGELAKGRKELTYEVGIPIAFSRADLSPKPAFLELLAYNIGASSRRVLTWELR